MTQGLLCIAAAFALPFAAVVGLAAARGLILAGRAALRWIRRAADDDPIGQAPHRCPICYDLAADEANGILRTDFELWESEWTP